MNKKSALLKLKTSDSEINNYYNTFKFNNINLRTVLGEDMYDKYKRFNIELKYVASNYNNEVYIPNATFDYPDRDGNSLSWNAMTTEQREEFCWTGIGNNSGIITEASTNFAEPYTSTDQCGYMANGGYLQQYIYLYTGRYTLTYYLSGNQDVNVFIGGELKDTSTPQDNLDWYDFTIDFDISTDGNYLLRFQCGGPATGIDNVSITRNTMNVPNATFDKPDTDNIGMSWNGMTTEQQEEFCWTGIGNNSGIITEASTSFAEPYTSTDQCGYMANGGYLQQSVYLYMGRYTLSYYLCGTQAINVFIDGEFKTTSTPQDNLYWYKFTVDFDIPSDDDYLLKFQCGGPATGIDNVSITKNQTINPLIKLSGLSKIYNKDEGILNACELNVFNNTTNNKLNSSVICFNPSENTNLQFDLIDIETDDVYSRQHINSNLEFGLEITGVEDFKINDKFDQRIKII